MEFLSEYGLFLAKTITIVVATLAIIGGIVALLFRSQIKPKEHLEIKHLNRDYEAMANALQSAMLSKKEFKAKLKALKKQHKAEERGNAPPRRKIFVLNFHGDIRATEVAELREEITAVLTVATPEDEVLLRLESPGVVVHAYGLAASQLLRLREQKISLTVAVDKVAASGGYLMACVADRIIAAPFAVVGSIGVVSQLPNFNRLLKRNDVDFEQFTAGEYKRTVTLFGEITERGREKFQQEIEEVHELFKDFVKEHRGKMDIDKVATGEHWYGAQAVALDLIDELRTSDDYLLAASKTADLFEVNYVGKKPLMARLLSLGTRALGFPGDDFPMTPYA
jgi:serine protease SohB